jgi:hypothetical protein
MGFTKRFINKEIIISTRNRGERITHLFNSDCVICLDDFSYKVLNLITQGASEYELKTMVSEYIHIE